MPVFPRDLTLAPVPQPVAIGQATAVRMESEGKGDEGGTLFLSASRDHPRGGLPTAVARGELSSSAEARPRSSTYPSRKTAVNRLMDPISHWG